MTRSPFPCRAIVFLSLLVASPASAGNDPSFDHDGDGFSRDQGDCDDHSSKVYPGAPELCDGVDNDCDRWTEKDPKNGDKDGDGAWICGSDADCDDDARDIHPFAIELCDGLDNDCDGTIDDHTDADGDGVNTCGADGIPGTADDDCHDGNPDIFPGAIELTCDGEDNDCDGELFEGEKDSDGDGAAPCDGDCDDEDLEVFPQQLESCDGVASNCQDLAPDERDGDEDGWMPCDGDCDDGDPDVQPEAFDRPGDGVDQNCSGADAKPCFEDRDGDGFGDEPVGSFDGVAGRCKPGAVARGGDCDDDDEDTWPGRAELADGQDNDCDGETDEDFDGSSSVASDGFTGRRGSYQQAPSRVRREARMSGPQLEAAAAECNQARGSAALPGLLLAMLGAGLRRRR
jgi:hypothetical protein